MPNVFVYQNPNSDRYPIITEENSEEIFLSIREHIRDALVPLRPTITVGGIGVLEFPVLLSQNISDINMLVLFSGANNIEVELVNEAIKQALIISKHIPDKTTMNAWTYPSPNAVYLEISKS